MRVLMVSKACVVGTYQRKLEEMVTAAPDLDLVVAVPPFWKDERGVTELEEAHTDGYRMVTLPLLFNGQFHLHCYPTLGKLLREVRPDIVHLDEEPYNLATFHANVLARRYGAKTLWFSWQNLRRRYPPPFAWMEAYNLRHVEHAIAGSQTAAQVWRQKGYTGPLTVIPQFGVDPELFSPPAQPHTGPVHIAYVGRLVPEKGVDVLLKALNDVPGHWRLSILGSGPEADRLKALSQQQGLEAQVTFRSLIPSMAMPHFYQEVDVLALPSRSRPNWTEQFGRVLIEAMACGASVIGSSAGEIPHVIQDAGIVFPEDDVDALKAALTHLITQPDMRQEFSRRGRQRVLAHFTQKQVALRTLTVYEEMRQ